MTLRPFIFATLLLATACGDRPPLFEAPRDQQGPFPAAGALLHLDRNTGHLIAVDPAARRVERIPIGDAPRRVLALGDTGTRRRVAVLADNPPRVHIVDLAQPRAASAPIALSKAFGAMTVHPAGQHLLLRFDPDAPGADRIEAALARSEYAVVDLRTRRSTHLAIDEGDSSIEGVVFPPDGVCEGGGARIAALILEDGVALIDLARPEIAPLRVPLSDPAGNARRATEMVFSRQDDAGRCYLFARAEGVDDIFALGIDPATSEGPSAFLNYLDGGTRPVSLLTFATPGRAAQVLVAYATGDLALLHAAAIRDEERRFDVGGVPTALLRLRASNDGRELALLFGLGDDSVAVFDPVDLRLLEQDLRGRAVRDARVSPLGDRAVLLHDGGPAAARFSVLRAEPDPARDRLRIALQSRNAGATTQEAVFAPDGSGLYLALTGLTLARIDLDGPPTSGLLELPAPSMDLGALSTPQGDFAFTLHDHPLGHVSFIPAGRFNADAIFELRGYLAADLLHWSQDRQR